MKKMPLFLKIVMVASAVAGTVGTIGTAGFLTAATLFSAPYTVNGRPASREDFMAFAVPVLGAYFALSALSLALAWGLRHERRWARPLIVGLAAAILVVPLTIAFLSGLDMSRAATSVLLSFAMLVVLWWQLYFDDDVLAYYEAIRPTS